MSCTFHFNANVHSPNDTKRGNDVSQHGGRFKMDKIKLKTRGYYLIVFPPSNRERKQSCVTVVVELKDQRVAAAPPLRRSKILHPHTHTYTVRWRHLQAS